MKAVIPAAGLGTRFLPVTKAQPKEMLPVVDKPAIQYVVEEAVASGIEDILIITGRGKRAIEDHFDRSWELEEELKGTDRAKYLKEIRAISELADIHYIRQKELLGLGHAISFARKHIDDEPFAVLLGDTITMMNPPCTKQLIRIYNKYKCSVIAVEPVPLEKVERYGIIKAEKVDNATYLIKDLVEKPSVKEAPSNLAIFGRYIITPAIFDCLERTKPGRGNEIQLTDALKLLLKREDIYAYEVSGKRYAIGNRLDWLIATIDLALERKDLGGDLRKYLKGLKI